MRRVVAYIDWFNLYHSIDKHLWSDYKWIDYRKMVQAYLWEGDELMDVFLFTAEPLWNKDKLARHRSFMDVLSKHCKIRIINWNYSSVVRNFNWDKMSVLNPLTREKLRVRVQPSWFSYETFEEKQTDVNLSLYILEGALRNYYDKAIVFSWDSDIAPAILMAKQHCPDKIFKWILPVNWKWRVISRACNQVKILNTEILNQSRLPDSLNLDWVTYHNPYKKQMPPLLETFRGEDYSPGVFR